MCHRMQWEVVGSEVTSENNSGESNRRQVSRNSQSPRINSARRSIR
jgi:hypothetical protein